MTSTAATFPELDIIYDKLISLKDKSSIRIERLNVIYVITDNTTQEITSKINIEYDLPDLEFSVEFIGRQAHFHVRDQRHTLVEAIQPENRAELLLTGYESVYFINNLLNSLTNIGCNVPFLRKMVEGKISEASTSASASS